MYVQHALPTYTTTWTTRRVGTNEMGKDADEFLKIKFKISNKNKQTVERTNERRIEIGGDWNGWEKWENIDHRKSYATLTIVERLLMCSISILLLYTKLKNEREKLRRYFQVVYRLLCMYISMYKNECWRRAKWHQCIGDACDGGGVERQENNQQRKRKRQIRAQTEMESKTNLVGKMVISKNTYI